MHTPSKKTNSREHRSHFLKEKLSLKDFDRWILAAPPEILSELRQHVNRSGLSAPIGALRFIWLIGMGSRSTPIDRQWALRPAPWLTHANFV